MRQLDVQEKKIVKELIRNPRASDNSIGKRTNVPIRTVSRKRKRLEEENILHYYANVNMQHTGTGRFNVRHMYVVTFRVGTTKEDILRMIMAEPKVKTVFTEVVYDSFIAEIDGKLAMLMVIEGKTDDDIVETFNSRLIPVLKKNLGKEAVLDIRTVRLIDRIRHFHNYIPALNMKNSRMAEGWEGQFIYVE